MAGNERHASQQRDTAEAEEETAPLLPKDDEFSDQLLYQTISVCISA